MVKKIAINDFNRTLTHSPTQSIDSLEAGFLTYTLMLSSPFPEILQWLCEKLVFTVAETV